MFRFPQTKYDVCWIIYINNKTYKMNINNLPILLNEYKNGNGYIEYLIDNEEYSDQHDNYTIENSLIVYEYIHNINEIVIELINNNIEFTHHIDDSDMSYLLINKNLFI